MLTQAAKICIAVTTILGVLAILIVGLRFYCRWKIQKISAGADDWCILVALLLSTGIAILTNYVAATTGVGDSSFTPTLDQVIFALKTNLGLENSQIVCMGLIKISLLLYYQRIFILDIFQLITNVLIAVVATFEISIVVAVLLSKGTPFSKQWNPMVPYTLNISAIVIAFCAGNAALDVITLALPLFIVRSLHLSMSKKLLLSVIFCFGSFCIIASIVRLYYAVQFTKVPATGGSFFQSPFIYNILWALIEPPVFIIAGCLLTLGPFFRSRYGPASLFRSLRSVWHSFSSRYSAKGSDFSKASKAEYPPPFGGPSSGSDRELWRPSATDSLADGRDGQMAWQLQDLPDVAAEKGKAKRSAQEVV